jgi:hypothetical protein
MIRPGPEVPKPIEEYANNPARSPTPTHTPKRSKSLEEALQRLRVQRRRHQLTSPRHLRLT